MFLVLVFWWLLVAVVLGVLFGHTAHVDDETREAYDMRVADATCRRQIKRGERCER